MIATKRWKQTCVLLSMLTHALAVHMKLTFITSSEEKYCSTWPTHAPQLIITYRKLWWTLTDNNLGTWSKKKHKQNDMCKTRGKQRTLTWRRTPKDQTTINYNKILKSTEKKEPNRTSTLPRNDENKNVFCCLCWRTHLLFTWNLLHHLSWRIILLNVTNTRVHCWTWPTHAPQLIITYRNLWWTSTDNNLGTWTKKKNAQTKRHVPNTWKTNDTNMTTNTKRTKNDKL